MKAFFFTAGLLSACAGFSQTGPLPLAGNTDSGKVIVMNYPRVKPYAIRNNRFNGGMPNAIAVTPLLTRKAGNNGNGFDLYQLQQDKMICLAPDSTNTSPMPVQGYQQLRVRKEAPDVKLIP